MSLGLVGKKIGMTRVFTEDGVSVPVTVIEVLPNRVTQIKTQSIDGYNGLQVTTGERRASRVSKAMRGHFAKAGTEPGRGVWEFPINAEIESKLGTELTVGLFTQGQKVDVSGRTIGKGFAGPIKRHGFRGGRASHGNSKAHRLGGSIGNAQDPGRVFKGKKMAGHMGAAKAMQQNLDVVRIDEERNIILIAGSIPGSKGADVIISPAVKSDAVLKIPAGNPESANVEENSVDVDGQGEAVVPDNMVDSTTESPQESAQQTATVDADVVSDEVEQKKSK